nr:histidine phosphatase family protein [uncultured Shinella sp.]
MNSEAKEPKSATGRSTRLTILCRGATAANQQSRFSSDGPLLARQAARLDALAHDLGRFDRVLHAPEPAAAETAAAFSSGALPVPALREVDYGAWNNRTLEDIAGQSPGDLERWRADPTSAPHGGEPFEAAQARATAWLESLHSTGGNTLAITHAIIVKLLFLHVVAAPLTSIWRIDTEPLSALTLTSNSRRWALRGFGPTAGDRSLESG